MIVIYGYNCLFYLFLASSLHSWATKLQSPSLSREKMNKPQTTGVKAHEHLIVGWDGRTIINVLEGAKQPLVSDKNKYFFLAANGPDQMCIHTQWRLLFQILTARIFYVTSFEGSASQDGHDEKWTRTVSAGWVTVLIPDSRGFFSPLFFFLGEGFPGRLSQCQHMLAPDGWCSPSCTSVTHFNRAAEERARRRDGARMPWGRSRRRTMRREKLQVMLPMKACDGGEGRAAWWMTEAMFLRVFGLRGQDGSTAVTAERNAS